ncbi:MAG TPA: glycosyltransferase family 39 protein [Gemmataceae bacterium]|nr:glycosyltransferase family 39 protein [Gemmataceae bacterium]
MSNQLIQQQETHLRKSWWREPEVAVLIVLVLAAYLIRIGDVSMRGEESRRARVAFEMLERGDWIVPREQGQPFLSRPPLQNWLIAASRVVCGSEAPWAVRLPSVLAMLLTALLIYGYARTCLSRVAALAASVAFVTFGEMFTTGCQAETEMIFIALVSASLLLWHWGQVRGWPDMGTWIVSYICVSLGVLCKGPQPPVYFAAAVVAYLLWTGQWRRLFSRAHLTGIAVGVAIVFAWLIPCAARTSWPDVWAIFSNDTSMRFRDWKALDVSVHLLRFPLEVLGCTLPWSFFLLGYLSRDLRRCLGEARPQTLFMALCVATSFPTCWIPPEGQTRYFAPLYPCLAVLIGLMVQCCLHADLPTMARAGWRRFTLLVASSMIVAGVVVMLASIFLTNHPRYSFWAERWPLALAYALAVIGLAVLIFKAREGGAASRIRTAVLAAACFMVLTFTGILTNVRVRRSEDQATAVARLKEQLPQGQRLVSLGHIDALFAYHYGMSIDPLSPDNGTDLLARENFYFCFDSDGAARPTLPFAWHEVAAISMDRNHHTSPERVVVIGRGTASQRLRKSY